MLLFQEGRIFTIGSQNQPSTPPFAGYNLQFQILIVEIRKSESLEGLIDFLPQIFAWVGFYYVPSQITGIMLLGIKTFLLAVMESKLLLNICYTMKLSGLFVCQGDLLKFFSVWGVGGRGLKKLLCCGFLGREQYPGLLYQFRQ